MSPEGSFTGCWPDIAQAERQRVTSGLTSGTDMSPYHGAFPFARDFNRC